MSGYLIDHDGNDWTKPSSLITAGIDRVVKVAIERFYKLKNSEHYSKNPLRILPHELTENFREEILAVEDEKEPTLENLLKSSEAAKKLYDTGEILEESDLKVLPFLSNSSSLERFRKNYNDKSELKLVRSKAILGAPSFSSWADKGYHSGE